ncbi:alanine--tRNA ligase [Candidatus Bipolaricaulota bacterium]|nr:alanine--tRNA ligase [Candidatus Bipolaricaulota bacterium]
MQADKLRNLYLEYFEAHGHTRLPSSSLVPNDPTLLFTAAGMVQFKDIFWGRRAPDHPRVTTCQKCFRTTDIENVGVTAFHHTFFEMLGNFSFGDYFKEGAISLAWKFVTEELGIPKEKLWVSVYEEDEEAYAIWKDVIGIPPERIARLGKEHNWWGPVGNSGPCGPDSEIFYDTGEENACGPDCRGVACDCDRFSEIWNLVFMQYAAREDGSLVPLERKNIDTGMGLERTAAVLQGVATDFEIDLFAPLIEAIAAAAEVEDRVARNIIADHVRGGLFLIADGVLPGNEKQGYVLRRILRRAVRAAERLGIPPGSLAGFIDPVIDVMGKTYPEIVSARALAAQVMRSEEDSFRRTLRAGERRLEERLTALIEAGERILPGEIAFELYDTYGFPLEMTAEIAGERGIEVDREGFDKAMAGQRARSRSFTENVTVSGSVSLDLQSTEFVGYEILKTEAELLRKVDGEQLAFVFDRTPFYAESGGQVGDTGLIENLDRPGRAEVTDVQKTPGGAFLHRVQIRAGEFEPGDRCRLEVNAERRARIARHHTATHLLHAALRKVLGEHVIQAGSLVAPEELRFDFSHFSRMTDEEIAQVEELVNSVVLSDIPVETQEMPLEEAKKTGAMAHFEEEYRGKARVRVVSVGEFSRELCGGTHVARTGEIGLVKITSEESVAAGTRRIHALAGMESLRQFQSDAALLGAVRARLGDDPLAGIDRLEGEISALRERLRAATEAILTAKRDELLAAGTERVGEVTIVSGRLDLEVDALKRLADLIEEKARPAVVLLGGAIDGRGIVVAKVSKGVSAHAGNAVRAMANALGGGGGGAPHFAQGGGPNAAALDHALAIGKGMVEKELAP